MKPTPAIIAVSASLAALSVVVGPLVLQGYPVGDNFEFNLPWLVHFIEQLSAGDLYPRWLTGFFAGYGAPIFHFYAPAPFYLGALANAVCGGCDVRTTLSILQVALYAGAGAAFFFWARSFGSAKLSLLCAVFYALAPYHVIDLEVRASLGESAAFIFMPLALLGLKNAVRTGNAPMLASLGYAGVVLSHLPTAVLFTPALAIFTLASASREARPRALFAIVIAGLCGAALAAVYLVPALAVREHLVADGWIVAVGPYFRPENWLFFSPGELSAEGHHTRKVITAAIAATTISAAIAVLIIRMMRNGAPPLFEGDDRRAVAAAAMTLAFCWLMMTGAARILYLGIDAFRQVQFPWRVGSIAELMSLTIIAISVMRIAAIIEKMEPASAKASAEWRATSVAVILAIGITVVCLKIGDVDRTRDFSRGIREESARLATAPPATPTDRLLYTEYPTEYRARGVVESDVYRKALGEAKGDHHAFAYYYWRAATLPLPPASISGGGEISIRQTGPTRFEIGIVASQAADVQLRRVYFPSWRLFDAASGAEIALRPKKSDGLMTFNVAAGRHSLVLKTAPLPSERLGAAISGAALVALFLTLLFRHLQRGGASRVTWPILRPGKASRLP